MKTPHHNHWVAMAIALALATPSAAQSIYPGVCSDKMAVTVRPTMRAQSFNLGDVRLLPSRFSDNMRRDSAWMMSISANRLLHSFRTNAGVFAGREGGYTAVKKLGGWESLDCDLRGHTTGHMLSALALMYAATGQQAFKAKGDSLVTGLAEVQAALGGGYLSAFPEELINRNLRATSVWAPWYTLHKIFAGLIDQYIYAGNDQALRVAVAMADWAYDKLSPQSEDTRRKMIRNEFGGVNEAFHNLYAITGDSRYQWLANYFYHNDVIDPLKASRDELGTKHTNTFIPKVIAEARNYELTGSPDSRQAATFFWDTMVSSHTFATGSSSQKEHFFDPKAMSRHINGYTGETCCTYNMLKLSRHLFCWTADARVADYYERALYNHILGQQDPATGMVCYFLPLLSGSHKVYSTPENSFWCCVGSGFESHAKYSEAIYYHSEDTMYVNLFIPSAVQWCDMGITITQQTDFPASPLTTLTISAKQSARATIRLRYPSWSGKAKVTVNGKAVATKAKPGAYIDITRQWRDGDKIEATFPMQLHLESTHDDPSRAALLYGPIVLAAEKGTQGMLPPAPFSDPSQNNDYYTYDYHVPEGLCDTLQVRPQHLNRDIRRQAGSLTFTTASGDTLRPLYDIHHQRYVVYWHLK